jgi:putative peptidoglycan lipid II flippase
MPADSEASHRHARLLKSTSVVGSMTLLSRITGLARDIAFSHWFGAGIVMDAFFVAFKVPNLLRRFFAEGAFSQAFVPVIAEYRATRSWAEARDLIDRASGTLGVMLFAITAIGVVAAPLLIMVFAPGFIADDGRYDLATDMLRFTFPYLFFISLTALAGGVLNTYGRFAVPAFTPVLLNLTLIAFAAWVAPRLERPAMGLALGVFAAGLVQLAFQVPFLLRAGLLPRPKWGRAHEGVRRILKLMLPVIFGSSVAQINILFDTLIASFLVTGSISWLYYSDRLVEFPLGVFGIALATVILPSLSEQHALASKEAFSATLDWALRCVLLVSLPAAVGLAVLAEPLLTTIFYGGEFTRTDVEMAAASLRAFAPGLVGFVLVKVLSPGYFARQDTRTPVRIGIRALALAMVLNVIFVVVLVYTQWAPAHAGLAAATTLSALFNSTLLLLGLMRTGVYRSVGGWYALFARVGGACIVMVVFVFSLSRVFGDWYALPAWSQVAALAVSVTASAGVYFAACYALGLRTHHFRLHAAA